MAIKIDALPVALSFYWKYYFVKFIMFLFTSNKNIKASLLMRFQRFLLVFCCLF